MVYTDIHIDLMNNMKMKKDGILNFSGVKIHAG